MNEIPIYNPKVAYKFILGKTNYTQYENLAEKLGYLKTDKLLILHADDLGLSKSVNQASFKALKEGLVNSGSVMMPCDFISDVGNFAVNNPEIDLGLHLTVTSEWRDYKWDGVAKSNLISSMIDKKGNLFENKKKFTLNASAKDLKKELQAQIDLAKSIGIKPTHIDSHEGALFFDQNIFKTYLEVGEENQLPVFVPSDVAVHFDKSFPKPENVVIVENFHMALPSLEFKDWNNYYINIIENLKPGLSEIIVHLG
ncbi:polysaccharide deacetylase family protein, partial [Flavobacteriaceae bacterium]|nr:polysaccharide deacetylase family protein [Flavobacteriaceae bacterium]